MNFKKYHVSRNLCPITSFDKTTDVYYTILFNMPIPTGTYTLSAKITSTSAESRISFRKADMSQISASNIVIQTGRSQLTVTLNEPCYAIYIYGGTTVFDNIPIKYENIMLNSGGTALPYEPYSSEVWHDTPHYIHNTSTDTITTPADIYANDTTATVGLKGNMEQASGVSPTTPIQPQECGDLTDNLYNASNPNIFKGYYDTSSNRLVGNPTNAFIVIPLVQGKKYYIYGGKRYNTSVTLRWVTTSSMPLNNVLCIRTSTFAQTDVDTITAEANENYLALFLCGDSDYSAYGTVENAIATNGANLVIDNGYKIPISSASTATPVYLGEVQTTRKIKRLVLTGSETFFKDKERTDSWRFYSNSLVSAYYNVSMCSHFVYIGTSGVNNTDDIGFSLFSASQFGCRCPKSVANTVNEFKAWLAAQYANDTPVTVWYVLATEETGTVNEPIRKIGDYADTVSGISIPTITGKDTVDVQTTLKPSEVELTYTGWHNATVKEWDGSEWQ